MMMYQVISEGGVLNLGSGEVIKPDQSSADWQAYRQWLKDGNTPMPPDAPPPVGPTPDDVRQAVTLATQARLDDFARTRNYDGILSAASYATDPSPRFASDGQCAVNARSATWAALYRIMAEVEAGTRPMPTSFADVESLLPALEWPA